MYGMPPMVMFGTIAFMLLGMLVQFMLKRKFAQFSKMPISSGLTGKEVAEKMLRENGILDVQVIHVPGMLTDHYDPTKKTVNLSDAVYNSATVAAAAVSAHECGHAVQHATQYKWIAMRSKLVPAVQISSSLVQWVLLAGIMLVNTFPQLLLGGVILFGVTTLFAFVTLPVEFDASKRALAWLEKTNITNTEEYPQAKSALSWAAGTYVVSAVASLFTLVQYLMIYLNASNRSDD
jgi:uncharacterized protein